MCSTLSIDTGEILWQYSANLDANITSVCCGCNNKGVAISEGRVFIRRLDGQLVALDRRTGTVAWSIQAARWQDNFSITAAPLYVNGMVIIGFAGGDRGTRGRLKAYDAKDGRLGHTRKAIAEVGKTGWARTPHRLTSFDLILTHALAPPGLTWSPIPSTLALIRTKHVVAALNESGFDSGEGQV